MKPTSTIPDNPIGRYLARHGGVVRDQAHCNYAVELPFHGDDGVLLTAWHRSLDPEGARNQATGTLLSMPTRLKRRSSSFHEGNVSGLTAALLRLRPSSPT